MTAAAAGPSTVVLDPDQYAVVGIALALVLAVLAALLVSSWRRS